MATEALVSIASGARVECLTVETQSNWAFLEDTNEITFSDEDIEVGYSNHRRPLYLAAFINEILVKRALVVTSALVNLIPLSTLQAARVLENKIQGYLMEVTGFGGKRWVHNWIHTALAESRPNSLLGSLPWSKDRGLVPCTIGMAMVA